MHLSGFILAHIGLTLYQSIAVAVIGVIFIGLRWLGHLSWSRAAAIAWSIAIFAGLSIPSNSVPDIGNGDKNIHAIIFAGFAFLWRWAGLSERRTLAWGVAYAVLSEVYQAVMPIGRSGDWQDALADVIGLLIGLVLARLFARIMR